MADAPNIVAEFRQAVANVADGKQYNWGEFLERYFDNGLHRNHITEALNADGRVKFEEFISAIKLLDKTDPERWEVSSAAGRNPYHGKESKFDVFVKEVRAVLGASNLASKPALPDRVYNIYDVASPLREMTIKTAGQLRESMKPAA